MLIDFNIQGVQAFGATLPMNSQLENSFSNWLPAEMKNVALVRKQEYIAGRFCAFQAAKMAGFDLTELPTAVTREPVWPLGVIGSITHSRQMAISCVSLSNKFSSLGIDAEELMKSSLGTEVENTIASVEELALVKKDESQKGITVLFSAKEALYKALFPLARTFIDFKEVKLVDLDMERESFELELLSCNPKLMEYLGNYKGSFKQVGETIVTLVSIPKMVSEGSHVHS
jgi:enterobactin synthetase component D